MKITARLIASFIIVLAMSCHHDGISLGNKRLAKIISHIDGNDSTVYSRFTYDSDGRLISLVDSMSTWQRFETRFFYSSDDRISSVHENFSAYPFIDSFIYDNNGRIGEMTLIVGQNGPIHSRRKLIYDNQGRLIGDTITYPNSQDYSYAVFDYNGGSDILSWKGYRFHDSVIDTSGLFQATYTSHLNPYGNMATIYYLIEWNNTLLSKHAIASYLPPPPGPKGDFGPPITYNYEFYPDGLIKSVTCIHAYPSPLIQHIDFYYE